MINQGNKNGFGNDSHTKLLAHFNNNFYDSSMSRTKFGASSGYFNGTSAYLSLADSADWDFGTGDFTVDWWMYLTNVTQWSCVVEIGKFTDAGFLVDLKGDQINFYVANSGSIVRTWTIVNNTWYHVAITRNGSSLKAFLNGVQLGATVVNSGNMQGQAYGATVGKYSGGEFTIGYIDEFRVSKGLARWTSDFSASLPTAYTADANTQLLLHMDGGNGSTTFTDSSSGAKTVTATNAVQYSGNVLTNNSGSFSGSVYKFGSYGAYLSAANSYLKAANSSDFSFGSGDFTVDFWFRQLSAPSNTLNFTAGVSNSALTDYSWYFQSAFRTSDNKKHTFTVDIGGIDYSIVSDTTYDDTNWHHLAGVRSGSTLMFFIDGIKQSTTQNIGSGSLRASTGSLGIGSFGDYVSGLYEGKCYIDEFRISKGVARWTRNFTPPNREY